MAFHLHFEQVSFSFPSASRPLFENLTLDFSPGWTGIVGANGSGKTTLLSLVTGQLAPTAGTVRRPRTVVLCPQRTDEPPPEFTEFLSGPDTEAYTIAAQLEIEDDWDHQWHRLSHGERKRSQIAVALWSAPAILALDEPTNHIDRNARDLLEEALRRYTGIGLLVSHDRDLLDTLTENCVFIDPPEARMRSGGYTRAQAECEREAATERARRERLDHDHRRLERELQRRRVEASRSHALRSKRGIPIKDFDARFKKNAARVSGKDGQAGRLMNQLKGRLGNLEARRDAIRARKERDLGIWVGAESARRPILLDLPPGDLRLDGRRSLQFPNLTINRDSRIGLVGPNGSGKSTLIRHLTASISWARDHLLLLNQEVPGETADRIARRVRSLPRSELGALMQTVSRLGSDPKRLLETQRPSPGEVRKLLVALGIRQRPWLIVMDEPTNHLDLPSIECLQAALADCPCALLLVSHDQRFLDALTTITWAVADRDRPVLRIT